MDTNQDTRTQAKKDLYKEVTRDLLKDIEKPHPDNGTKREENGKIKKNKEEKNHPRKRRKSGGWRG